MFHCFNAATESRYAHLLHFRLLHTRTLDKLYNGSSFNKGTGFFLLLVLNPWVTFPIPTTLGLSPSFHHFPDGPQHHSAPNTLLHLRSTSVFTSFPSGHTLSETSVWSKSYHPSEISSMLLPLPSDPFWFLLRLLRGNLLVLSSLLDF